MEMLLKDKISDENKHCVFCLRETSENCHTNAFLLIPSLLTLVCANCFLLFYPQ